MLRPTATDAGVVTVASAHSSPGVCGALGTSSELGPVWLAEEAIPVLQGFHGFANELREDPAVRLACSSGMDILLSTLLRRGDDAANFRQVFEEGLASPDDDVCTCLTAAAVEDNILMQTFANFMRPVECECEPSSLSPPMNCRQNDPYPCCIGLPHCPCDPCPLPATALAAHTNPGPLGTCRWPIPLVVLSVCVGHFNNDHGFYGVTLACPAVADWFLARYPVSTHSN